MKLAFEVRIWDKIPLSAARYIEFHRDMHKVPKGPLGLMETFGHTQEMGI